MKISFPGNYRVAYLRWASIAFLLMALSVSWVWGGALSPPPPVTQPGYSGEPAVDFRLPDLEGNLVTLSEQRGKVVLLTFWASWCPPCRQEMPALNRVYETLGGPDLTVLGVNIENRPEPARRFAEKFGLTFPVLLGGGNPVTEQYGIFNIPQSFLIDKNGRILQRYVGYHDWMMEESLDRLRSLIRKP